MRQITPALRYIHIWGVYWEKESFSGRAAECFARRSEGGLDQARRALGLECRHFKHDGLGRARKMLKKLHLKRNAVDRFALCGIWPDDNFVLMAAMPRESAEVMCQTCIRVATANLERRDAGNTPQLRSRSSAS